MDNHKNVLDQSNNCNVKTESNKKGQKRKKTKYDINGNIIYGKSKNLNIKKFDDQINKKDQMLLTTNQNLQEHTLKTGDSLKYHNICTNNCCNVAIDIDNFINHLNHDYRREKATKFITENFNEVKENGNFKKIDFNAMVNLLSSDDLKIFSEEDLFLSLIIWISSNKENNEIGRRVNKIDKCCLLKQIRFTHLSKTFITERVLQHLDSCISCIDIYKNLICWYLNPILRAEITLNVNGRRFYIQSLMHITTDKNLQYKDIKTFDKSWSLYYTIETQIKYSCAAILMDRLILFGGFSGGQVTNNMWCLDMRSKVFETMTSPMNQKRIFFDVAVVKNKLYAIGGMTDDLQGIKNVEMWENSSKWTNIAPLNQARYHPAAVTHDNKIYVFGGYCGKKYLKSYEIYDPENDKWEIHQIEDDIYCYDYCHIKAAVLENEIYVYECFKKSLKPNEHHVKCLNLTKSQWKELPPLLEECHNLMGCNGKILFFGLKNNYEYDPEKNTWERFMPDYIISKYNHVLSVPNSIINHQFQQNNFVEPHNMNSI